MASGGNPKESATENIPPMACTGACIRVGTGKGEMVGALCLNVRAHRDPGDRVGMVNPIRSKSK